MFCKRNINDADLNFISDLKIMSKVPEVKVVPEALPQILPSEDGGGIPKWVIGRVVQKESKT